MNQSLGDNCKMINQILYYFIFEHDEIHLEWIYPFALSTFSKCLRFTWTCFSMKNESNVTRDKKRHYGTADIWVGECQLWVSMIDVPRWESCGSVLSQAEHFLC